jgi:hypothetical protein
MNNSVTEKLVKLTPFAVAAFSVVLAAHGASIGHLLNIPHLIHNGDPGGNTGPNIYMRVSGDPGGNTGPN